MKLISFIQNTKSRVLNLKGQFEKNVDSIIGFSEYLENGTYRSDAFFKLFYNSNYKKFAKNVIKHLSKYVIHSLKFKEIDFSTFLAEKIVLRICHIKINSENKIFNGHTIMISSSGNEAKIIDYTNNLMITVFTGNDRIAAILNKRNLVDTYLPTPEIINVDKNNHTITEKYIPQKYISSEKQYELILKDIVSIKRDSSPCSEYCSKEFARKIKEEIKRLNIDYENAFSDFIKSGFYKKGFSHGDMFRANTVFDGKSLKYIDYESASVNNHIFFFDALYYIFFEIRHFREDKIYDNYIGGMYDKYFTDLFLANGLEYNPAHKKLYFLICLMEVFNATNIPEYLKYYIE